MICILKMLKQRALQKPFSGQGATTLNCVCKWWGRGCHGDICGSPSVIQTLNGHRSWEIQQHLTVQFAGNIDIEYRMAG